MPVGLIDNSDVEGMLPREVFTQFMHAAQPAPLGMGPSDRSLVICEPDDLWAT